MRPNNGMVCRIVIYSPNNRVVQSRIQVLGSLRIASLQYREMGRSHPNCQPTEIREYHW